MWLLNKEYQDRLFACRETFLRHKIQPERSVFWARPTKSGWRRVADFSKSAGLGRLCY